jgi:REP element-mobilizing transposase RayT
MAQTLFSSYLHIVFSTKNRFDFIHPEVEDDLYAYIGGIVRKFNCVLMIAGGAADHIHLLVSLNKNILVPDLIGGVKRDSSKWIKTKGGMLTKFGWQDGYSAFSVGHAQIPAVKKYISSQKEHHQKVLFMDEMRSFYKKYGVEFDERYVWD